jgi:hypothetical protein
MDKNRKNNNRNRNRNNIGSRNNSRLISFEVAFK